MGLRAVKGVPVPLGTGIQPADLIRLCPGCDTPLEAAPAAGAFAVGDCPRCGLSLMTPRSIERRW